MPMTPSFIVAARHQSHSERSPPILGGAVAFLRLPNEGDVVPVMLAHEARGRTWRLPVAKDTTNLSKELGHLWATSHDGFRSVKVAPRLLVPGEGPMPSGTAGGRLKLDRIAFADASSERGTPKSRPAPHRRARVPDLYVLQEATRIQ